MNAIATVDCPKCFAAGALRHFAHVHGGVCFLCLGARTVSVQAAARWLASQVEVAPCGGDARTTSAPARPSKTVDMGAWGKVLIARLDDGTFTARDVQAPDDGACGYTVYFAVVDGRVAVDADCVQHGMTRHWRAFEAALQSALRA